MMDYRERKETCSWNGGEVERTSEEIKEKKTMIKIYYIKSFIFNKNKLNPKLERK